MSKTSALLLASLLAPIVFGPGFVGAQELDPVAVLDARQEAENAHDVDGALAWFADDAVVRLSVGSPQERLFVGSEQIRGWLEGLIQEQVVAVESGEPRQVHYGNTVTWTSWVSLEQWRRLGIESLEFWGLAIVHGGKIKILANGPTPESAEQLRSAFGTSAS